MNEGKKASPTAQRPCLSALDTANNSRTIDTVTLTPASFSFLALTRACVVYLPRGNTTALAVHSLRGSACAVHFSSWRNRTNLLCATETHARRRHRRTPYQPSGRAHFRAYRHGRCAVGVPVGPLFTLCALLDTIETTHGNKKLGNERKQGQNRPCFLD